MQDRRSVKILLHCGQGDFLVLRRSGSHPLWPHEPDLPGGVVKPGEEDLAALDREISEEIGLALNTEDALQVGYDAEYEPGEGMMTRVLYMLKLETERPTIRLSSEHEGFDWATKDDLRGFSPAYQVLVQTAVDFYL